MKILAPAKINLSLKIGKNYPNGYHTVMHTLKLADILQITPAPDEKIFLQSSGWPTPRGSKNIIVQAVEVFKNFSGLNRGVKILLNKKIPVQAGLGGGSSDAAATLLALNKIWKCNLPKKKLLEVAFQLGSDVPFFILGGAARITGQGEKIKLIKPMNSNYGVVLLKPSFGAQTSEAYQAWDKIKNLKFKIKNDFEDDLKIKNDFEYVILPKHPLLFRLKKFLLEQGAIESGLSGSGSTIFGIFKNFSKAQQVAQKLKKKIFWCITTRFYNW